MDAAGTGFAIVSALKTGGYRCIDGTNQSKSTTGTGDTLYTGVSGTDTATEFFALVDSADLTCN